MLAIKGVADAVAAARLLKQRGVALRLWLVGPSDSENPTAIPPATLRGWQQEGLVEWLGQVDDIAGLWRRAHIALLPSHGGEGLPNTLLEAAAAGRPMIATDVPGCRELVRTGETGILVPPRDPAALADALARLAADAALRQRLGAAARRLVEDEFGEARVAGETLALYRLLLPGWH
jgi:glycosyltransferase involved in cell wall biosynthesis